MKRCHGKIIEADYHIRFGAPRLVENGIPVSAVVNAAFAGGIDNVQKTFELPEALIWRVRDYVQKLIERDGEGVLAEVYWEGRKGMEGE